MSRDGLLIAALQRSGGTPLANYTGDRGAGLTLPYIRTAPPSGPRVLLGDRIEAARRGGPSSMQGPVPPPPRDGVALAYGSTATRAFTEDAAAGEGGGATAVRVPACAPPMLASGQSSADASRACMGRGGC